MLRPAKFCNLSAMALVLCALALWLAVQTPSAQTPSAKAPPAARTVPAPPPPAIPTPTPEQLAIQAASNKDRQRMMELLGIKILRPGASGSTNGPNPANYDEVKADLHLPLPNPLVLNNGQRVTTAKMWWTERRPQIAELFNEDIYGRVPAHLPKVTWEVVSVTREKNGDVPVITKTLVGHVDNSIDPAITVNIDLTLSTPADAKGPIPVMMEFGLSKAIMEMFAKRFPQFAAMAGTGPTWQQQVLAKGWDTPSTYPQACRLTMAPDLSRA